MFTLHPSYAFYYAISSLLLFGIMYWENGMHEILATLAPGFATCLLYAKLRSIWPFVIAHTWFDIAAD